MAEFSNIDALIALKKTMIALKKTMIARESSLTSTPREESRVEKLIKLAAMGTDANPTEKQKQSGNYKKGRFSMKGLTFVIENPKGTVRSGDGWSVVSPAHYGYILKNVSEADGDHIDVYIGPYPDSKQVYVIDQRSFVTGEFDEHKVMVGFNSKEEAKGFYYEAFNGTAPFMGIVEMSWDELKSWMSFGNTSSSAVDQMLRTFSSRIEIMKSIEEKDGSVYLYGACMVPNVVDKSEFRDYYDEDDVRKSSRAYLANSRAIGFRHKGIIQKEAAHLTQSFIAPSDMTIGENNIPKGSWVIEVKLDHPELIRMAKSGDLSAFSIGGSSKRWRLERTNGEKSRWCGPGAKN